MENNLNEQNETLNNQTVNQESVGGGVSSNDFINNDQNINSFSDNSNKRVKSGSYNATLLLAWFFGGLGIHRFINSKIISGVIMVLLSIFSFVPFVVYMVVAADSLDSGETSAWIIGFILISLALIVPIWVFVDVIVIMAGKFKNKKTGEYVTSGKSFIQTWGNIVVLVLIVLSMILTPIIVFSTGVFSFEFGTEPAVIDDGDDEDDDEGEEEISIKDSMEESYEEFIDNADDNGYSVYLYGEESGFSAEYEINYYPDGTYDFYLDFDGEGMTLICGVDGEYSMEGAFTEFEEDEDIEYTEEDIKEMCDDNGFGDGAESTIETLLNIDIGDLFDLDEEEYEEEKKYYSAEIEGGDYDYEMNVYKDGETLEATSKYLKFTIEVM